jgi:beta-lactamase class A
MTSELARLVAGNKGRVAVVLKDLKSGRTWTHHPDDLFPSASLIKVPIMATVFQRIRDGQLSLSDVIRLRRSHRVGGSGSVKWMPDGSRLKVKDLLYKMIGESDNTATAMLIDAVGMGYIQAQFPNLGLFYTEIFAEGMSIRGGRVAHENYTTAKEMAMLLEKIYQGELVDKNSSIMMLDILRHRKTSRSRLAKGLPRGWEIAHKTGLLRQACHDSAIFMTPHGNYLMTVLTGSNGNYRRAKDFISRLGRVTFDHYDATRYLAKASSRRGQFVVR